MTKRRGIRSLGVALALLSGVLILLNAALFEGPHSKQAADDDMAAIDTLLVDDELAVSVHIDVSESAPATSLAESAEDDIPSRVPTRSTPRAEVSGRVAYNSSLASAPPAELDANPVTIQADYDGLGWNAYLTTMSALGGRAFLVVRTPRLQLLSEYDLDRRRWLPGRVDPAGIGGLALGLARELRNDAKVTELLPTPWRGQDVALAIVLPRRIESYLRAGLRKILDTHGHALETFRRFEGSYISDDGVVLRIRRGVRRDGREVPMNVDLELLGGGP